jgi:hypothetical protein
LVRFFFSPVAAVFFPASFFSAGALEAGALEAGFFSAAALGGILDWKWSYVREKSLKVLMKWMNEFELDTGRDAGLVVDGWIKKREKRLRWTEDEV